MAPKSFLFVNKNPQSDSLSNSRRDRLTQIQINQHAGHNASRKKRRRAIVKAESLVDGQQVFAPRGSIEAATAGVDGFDTNHQEGQLRWMSATPSDTLAKLSPRERHMLLTSPGPEAPISLLPNYLTTLTPREHYVLQHYTSIWMPAYAGHGTTTGFTVLSSSHVAFSSFNIQSALQTADPFSLYAFLVMAAQRMHLTGALAKLEFTREHFSAKSVQALRNMKSRPFSEELVLSLANFILGEAYIKRLGSPAVSVYRIMQRDLIVKAGGFLALSSATSQIAVAYDIFTSQGTLTLPYLDVYRCPALLGIQFNVLPDSQADRHERISQRLKSMDPALRVLLESCHDLSELVTSIGRLDSYAIKGLATVISANIPGKMALYAATLQRSGSMQATLSAEESNLLAADALWMRIRQQIYVIWVWHIALGVSMSTSSPQGSESPAMSPVSASCVDPTCVTRGLSELWWQLDQVQSQLQYTGWKLRMKTVLWICAVCFLTTTSKTEQQAYILRFESSVAALEVSIEEELRVVLGTMLPLEHFRAGGDVVSCLWNELIGFRGRSIPVVTVIGIRNATVKREERLGRAIIQECSSEEGFTP